MSLKMSLTERADYGFESLETSVKTFIIYMNIDVNIEHIFSSRVFPIEPYEIPQKKRGRKKKSDHDIATHALSDGSIIHVNFRDQFYGNTLKNASEFFRNAMTIVIFIDGKFLNFKLTQKGKLQLTGCKTDEQAKKCVYYFWKHLKSHTDSYTMNGDFFSAYYEPVMRNIGFSVNFKINRHKLDEYINANTDHISIFETTLGYAGVNIKFNITNSEEIAEKFTVMHDVIFDDNRVESSFIPHNDLLLLMNVKRKKKKYITFLVFQSGKVIMSGTDLPYMKTPYYEFMSIIDRIRDDIEEKI